jgi:hypothetical protein
MSETTFSNIGLYNFMFYASFCVLFIIISLYTDMKKPILMFIITSYLLQFALNTAATANPLVCSKINPMSAALFTLIPWLLILGVGNFALNNFHGWVRIFANSFGMWFAYHLKTEDFLEATTAEALAGKDEQYKELYSKLVLDPKKIINEIDFIGKSDKQISEEYPLLIAINPTIFGKVDDPKDVVFIPKFETFKPDGSSVTITEEVKVSKRANDIIKTIKLKNKLGYLIWNILLGIIASMISTNSLINSECSINII